MAPRESPASSVERLIAAGRWSQARRVLPALLKEHGDDHWLLSRLALTYYERRDYRTALELDRRAVRIAPNCPLALWGLAGSHQMLGDDHQAAAIYQRLVRRGAARLASGRCGEGMRWARGLVADSWYRLGVVYESRRDHRRARLAYRRALDLRRGGASIYTASEIRGRLRDLDT